MDLNEQREGERVHAWSAMQAARAQTRGKECIAEAAVVCSQKKKGRMSQEKIKIKEVTVL